MVTMDDATRIAQTFLDAAYPPGEDRPSVVVDESATVEKPYGWLFRYDTTTALQTGDARQGLTGAGPLLVLRENGRIIEFSSFYSAESALEAYEDDPTQFRQIEPGRRAP